MKTKFEFTSKQKINLLKDFIAGYWRDNPVAEVGPNVSRFCMEKLGNTDLSYLDLSGISFNAALLDGVNFTACKLQGCDFTRATMTHVDLTQIQTNKKTNFVETTLDHCDFTGAKFYRCHFDKTKITHSKFAKAFEVADVDWSSCRFDGTSFADGNLLHVNCAGVNFAELTFVNVTIISSMFTAAHLRGAYFENCVLKRNNFEHACLNLAKLFDCYIKQCDVTAADLSDASLLNSKFHVGTDFGSLTMLTLESLNGVGWLYGAYLMPSAVDEALPQDISTTDLSLAGNVRGLNLLGTQGLEAERENLLARGARMVSRIVSNPYQFYREVPSPRTKRAEQQLRVEVSYK